MTNGKSDRSVRIVVIGAGISGLLVGIRLRQRGITRFTIVEKAADVGGVWLQNSYPGLACDVPIRTYTYAFAPDAGWTHRFASGADILRYYRSMVPRYKLAPHIRCNTEIAAARWQDGAWSLTTTAGEVMRADVVISAVGRLHHPAMPDIEGLDSFAGPVFHSAQWRHDLSLAGKRVGIIGTGSTAVQILSALSPSAATLNLFQRTPQWIVPSLNAPLSPLLRRLLQWIPPLAQWHGRKLEREQIGLGRQFLAGKAPIEAMCRNSLNRIADDRLRAKLTPDYDPGCKRLVSSPDFYEIIQQPHVTLTTEPIDHLTHDGVVTADGQLHALDALVLATGFQTLAYLQPMSVIGRNGVVLDELWADTNLNYKSVAIPHMPNFFTINGPYTPSGASSYVPVGVAQVDFVMQCIDHIGKRKIAIAPRLDRTLAQFAAVRAKAMNTVWGTGGCDSGYLDKTGVPMVNPQALDEVRIDLAKPDLADFEEIALSATFEMA